MNRLLVFILAIFYLATTTGTSMHLHFCMGKLSDWSLWEKNQDKNCGKCGMEKNDTPNGCCNDEHKWVKIEDDQKANAWNLQLTQLEIAEPVNFLHYNLVPEVTTLAELHPNSHAPPRSCSDIYKRNCVFLI